MRFSPILAGVLAVALLVSVFSVRALSSDNLDESQVSNVTLERTFDPPKSQVWIRAIGSDVTVYLNFQSADPDTKIVYDGDIMITPRGRYRGYQIVVGGTATDVHAWHWD